MIDHVQENRYRNNDNLEIFSNSEDEMDNINIICKLIYFQINMRYILKFLIHICKIIT